MKISVAVMAHPSRALMVETLCARLDAPAKVVWDEKNVEWDTGRRALLAYDPSATSHLVLQDDCVIPRDLVAGLTKALERTGKTEQPWGLYWGSHGASPDVFCCAATAQLRGLAYMQRPGPTWGPAVLIPTEQIPWLVAACDDQPGCIQYDTLMDRSYRSRHIECVYPLPSLVDHLDTPSLLGHSDGRHANEFIGANASALGWANTIDEGNGYVGPVYVDAIGKWACSECGTWRPEESSIINHMNAHHAEAYSVSV